MKKTNIKNDEKESQDLPNLRLAIGENIKTAMMRACEKRMASRVPLFGPLEVRGNTLFVSPFEIQSVLGLVERNADCELDLFRVKRTALAQLDARLRVAAHPTVIRAYEDAIDYLTKTEVGLDANRAPELRPKQIELVD